MASSTIQLTHDDQPPTVAAVPVSHETNVKSYTMIEVMAPATLSAGTSNKFINNFFTRNETAVDSPSYVPLVTFFTL